MIFTKTIISYVKSKPNIGFNELDSIHAYGSWVKYTIPMFICLSNPSTKYYN